MKTTIGQVMVNNALPPDYRDYGRVMSKGETDAVLEEIARTRPDLYKDISWRLMQLGRHAAFEEGMTLRLRDLQTGINKQEYLDVLDAKMKAIDADKTSTDAEKQEAKEELWSTIHDTIKSLTYEDALARDNPFALQVKSKARGNADQLSSLLATPGVYTDHKGHAVPVFIRRSYAEGLEPHEYFAAAYGARTGVMSTKTGTRKAGYLGKLFASAAMDSVVTDEDCGTPYGVPVRADDMDNIGAVLARDVGKLPAGTVITKSVLAELQRSKADEILVRSPMTCGLHKGLCKKCVGLREDGKFPPIGYNVGLNASSALAEQLAQSALNLKHCLTNNTLVLMADWTSKEIKDVKVGDYVMGCGVDQVMRPVRVLNVFDNGPRECWRTTFKRNGTQGLKDIAVIESTLDHNILASRRVVGQLDEKLNYVPRILPIGTTSKHFYAELPTKFDDTGLFDEPYALLLGLLLGDGCYTESVNGVHFSCADLTQIDDMSKYLEPLGLKMTKLAGHDYYYRVSQIQDYGATSVSEQPNSIRHPVRAYLTRHGMYGKYAHEKTLPPTIDTWSNKAVLELLAGLIVTDGSIYLSDSRNKVGVSLASTSQEMLAQVRRLLRLRFGILASNITRCMHAGTGNAVHDGYSMYITSFPAVRRLQQLLPLIGVKRERFAERVAAYERLVSPRVAHHESYTRVSQEPIGMQPTMDIEVDHPDHLFVLANGLVVSNSGKRGSTGTSYAGFDVVKNLATVPATFPNTATVSEFDGKVDKVVEAPQGGYHVYVDGNEHYVPAGAAVSVKEGDTVEAGDMLSSGILNPADVVRLKGVGEGRRYFTEAMTRAFRETNYGVNRRNVETLARSLVNHVNIDDMDAAGQYLPGDTTTYSAWAYGYKPRRDAQQLPLKQAVGKYLEAPALHYTIGTRISKQMAEKMKKFEVDTVLAHPEPVGVSPHMVSVVNTPEYTDDWMARLSSSYLKTRLMEDVHRGATSQAHSLHPIPSLAKGVEFGQQQGKKFTY